MQINQHSGPLQPKPGNALKIQTVLLILMLVICFNQNSYCSYQSADQLFRLSKAKRKTSHEVIQSLNLHLPNGGHQHTVIKTCSDRRNA